LEAVPGAEGRLRRPGLPQRSTTATRPIPASSEARSLRYTPIVSPSLA